MHKYCCGLTNELKYKMKFRLRIDLLEYLRMGVLFFYIFFYPLVRQMRKLQLLQLMATLYILIFHHNQLLPLVAVLMATTIM